MQIDRVVRDVSDGGGERLVFLASWIAILCGGQDRLCDQVQNYAARKKISLEEAERWLSPNLGLRPGCGCECRLGRKYHTEPQSSRIHGQDRRNTVAEEFLSYLCVLRELCVRFLFLSDSRKGSA